METKISTCHFLAPTPGALWNSYCPPLLFLSKRSVWQISPWRQRYKIWTSNACVPREGGKEAEEREKIEGKYATASRWEYAKQFLHSEEKFVEEMLKLLQRNRNVHVWNCRRNVSKPLKSSMYRETGMWLTAIKLVNAEKCTVYTQPGKPEPQMATAPLSSPKQTCTWSQEGEKDVLVSHLCHDSSWHYNPAKTPQNKKEETTGSLTWDLGRGK